MISEIKSIISTEIFDLQNYKPNDLENFSFQLSLTVGIKGKPGGDIFNIHICTPKWLLDNYNLEELILGKHKLIVFEFDMQRILKRIQKMFDGCGGKDWNEIAIKLSRIGHWEFEDYRP